MSAPSGYLLGVDLGTSHTVAVIRWPDGRARPLLVDGAPVMPSAVFIDEAGHTHVGRDAQRLAQIDPSRFEPNPKHRIGEGEILLGDREVSAVSLLSAVLRTVAAKAVESVGHLPPAVLTYPAKWGATRRGILEDAAARAGFPPVRLVPEPVAAAHYFAEVMRQPIPVGASVAVFDFGGGTLDIAVVKHEEENRFTVLADGGLDDLGGLDVDEVLLNHLGETITAQSAETWKSLTDPQTPTERRNRRLFRDDVRGAKEMLSRTTVAPVPVPGVDSALHLTRDELERLASPLMERAVDETRRVIGVAGLEPDGLAGLFLVGGASRMPLVARLLHSKLGIAPTVLEQPELPVAEGCLAAAEAAVAAPVTAPPAATAEPVTPQQVTPPPAFTTPTVTPQATGFDGDEMRAPDGSSYPDARTTVPVSGAPYPTDDVSPVGTVYGGSHPVSGGGHSPSSGAPYGTRPVSGGGYVDRPATSDPYRSGYGDRPVSGGPRPDERSYAHGAATFGNDRVNGSRSTPDARQSSALGDMVHSDSKPWYRRRSNWIGVGVIVVVLAVGITWLAYDPYGSRDFNSQLTAVGEVVPYPEDGVTVLEPALDGNTAIHAALADDDLILTAVDLETGTKSWESERVTAAGGEWTSVIAEYGIVTARSSDGSNDGVALFDGETGEKTGQISTTVDDEVAIVNDVVVVTDKENGAVVGYDVNGEEQWRAQTDVAFTAMREVRDWDSFTADRGDYRADALERVYVRDDEGAVVYVDTADGDIVSSGTVFTAGDPVYGYDGKFYVADGDNGYTVSVYDLENDLKEVGTARGAGAGVTPKVFGVCGETRVCVLEERADADLVGVGEYDSFTVLETADSSVSVVGTRQGEATMVDVVPVGTRIAAIESGDDGNDRIQLLDEDLETIGDPRNGRFRRIDAGSLMLIPTEPTAVSSSESMAFAGITADEGQVFELGTQDIIPQCTANATHLTCPTEAGYRTWRFRG